MKNIKKLPPHGSALAERQKFLNLPFLVVVCVGQDSWNSAKRWNSRGDNCGLVLPSGENPERFTWPVTRCTCVIEWNAGPDSALIINLVRCLLLAGADLVVVWPRFVDYRSPIVAYDDTRQPGDRWVQCRETIRIYRNSIGGSRVSA
ncbi:hypothetical protein [Methylomonas rapida]|uniref:Uncharacterized protein n=1 Tax=Methylomonas rapida TaxID=2963939 RepID=A0ABY7GEL6_9GAMM|nr:hypothetical protein [Methylomonas rapida]WAR43725.1 hypothetical protein NM686_015240 [Methylomonas rapida]